MYLNNKKIVLETVVSRTDALDSIRKFVSVVEKPNVMTATDATLAHGVGTIVMYGSDTKEEKSFLHFPLTTFKDTFTVLIAGEGTQVLQDRIDVMYVFDQYYKSKDLFVVDVQDTQEYLFINTDDCVSFSISFEVTRSSYAIEKLVSILYISGETNINNTYQRLIFDKLLPPKEKEDKK